jgi:putative NIF3 family GTP cyclohydrolase 1 type 2
MRISEVIQKIKDYSRGKDAHTNQPIDDALSRDQVLYGSIDKECTGIVTTCFASVEVIEKAHACGANLIISHEALFWNHGDHTDWLKAEKNSVYLRKKKLLDDYGITVWRDHDYIHSGMPGANNTWYDGIFKGFLHDTGLEKYYVPNINDSVKYSIPVMLNLPGLTVREVADMIIKGAGLNGIRLIGDPDAVVHNACIPMHLIGFADKETISMINIKNIDLLITMELIDYTVNEYMRDGACLGDPKAILACGHFNTEEPGMKYMLNWLPEALGTDTIPMTFIKSGDASQYILP